MRSASGFLSFIVCLDRRYIFCSVCLFVEIPTLILFQLRFMTIYLGAFQLICQLICWLICQLICSLISRASRCRSSVSAFLSPFFFYATQIVVFRFLFSLIYSLFLSFTQKLNVFTDIFLFSKYNFLDSRLVLWFADLQSEEWTLDSQSLCLTNLYRQSILSIVRFG